MSRPKIAIVGTGGTIASVGVDTLDLATYAKTGKVYALDELLALVPELDRVADVVQAPFRQVHSTAIGPADWPDLVRHIEATLAADPAIAGCVVTHGTATLEETAYFLNLTLKTEKTVVVIGAQRPPTGLSTDAFLNLVNGARVAGAPEARGLGVLVCLNDEIHAARDATKTSTFRLQTFRSPDMGLLGHADPDRIAIYRRPVRTHAPHAPFSADAALPRVDMAISYAGSDGAQIRGLIALGPAAIVVAGFAPGLVTPGEKDAIQAALDAGVQVVQGTRALSGRVVEIPDYRPAGVVVADNLPAQKARVLAMVAIANGATTPAALQAAFDTY